jgi:predicted dehydrogenase
VNDHQLTVSRRRFLGTGVAAAGAFTILKPELVRGSQASSKITVGLIGCGNRGTHDAGLLIGTGKATITVLCDLFEDRTEAAMQKLKLDRPAVHTDYQKVLASGVDAVIIATPPFEHPPMLEAAVQARKHVYCEKPMGVDLAGCKRVIAAGRKADPKKCISVGFQQRYGPVYKEAYKRVTGGDIGELAVARAYWIGSDPFKRVPYPDPKIEKIRNWFCFKDLSGDFIVEQDCHNFDVLHWFLGGLPLRAVGYGGRKVRTSMDLLDRLSLTFEWPNDIQVAYEANQLTPRGYSKVGEEFTGTKGTIQTSRGGLIHTKGPAPNDVENIKSREPTADAMEEFANRILSGDVENVAERSARSTLIALLGREATYSRKEVTWKGLFGSV